MIKNKELRIAIVSLIKRLPLELEIHFNHVDKSKESYVYVEIEGSQRSLGGGYYQREIEIDLQFVMIPPEGVNVKRNELLDIVERLDEILQLSFNVSDRHLTVLESNYHIFDEILHYEFRMEFTDAIGKGGGGESEVGVMRELEMKLEKGEEIDVKEV